MLESYDSTIALRSNGNQALPNQNVTDDDSVDLRSFKKKISPSKL